MIDLARSGGPESLTRGLTDASCRASDGAEGGRLRTLRMPTCRSTLSHSRPRLIPSGSLGCRGDVPALPATRGWRSRCQRRRLRSRLRRRSSRALPQGVTEPCLWHGEAIGIRRRFGWDVPEPELASGSMPTARSLATRSATTSHPAPSRATTRLPPAGQGLLTMRGARSRRCYGRRVARRIQPGNRA